MIGRIRNCLLRNFFSRVYGSNELDDRDSPVVGDSALVLSTTVSVTGNSSRIHFYDDKLRISRVKNNRQDECEKQFEKSFHLGFSINGRLKARPTTNHRITLIDIVGTPTVKSNIRRPHISRFLPAVAVRRQI